MPASRLTGLPVTVVQACLRDGEGGSPTAVVTDAAWLGDEERRQVPALTGASHAVYLDTGPDSNTEPDSDTEPDEDGLRVRFFTAEGELPACGHGTVAAFAYLAERSGKPEYQASLRAAGGRRVRGRAQRQADLVSADFEAGRVELREPTVAELAFVPPALGLRNDAASPGACVATLGRPRMLVPVSSRSALAALRPDMHALRDACLQLGLLGCYAYTVPTGHGRRYAARMFAPAIGVPEDIANANSTACLAAHLHPAAEGSSDITVDMGDCVGSPATITAAVVDAEASIVYAGGAARVGRTVVLE